MAYNICLKRSAEKDLDRLPQKTHTRIVNVFISLKENSLPQGVKKLHGREGYRKSV